MAKQIENLLFGLMMVIIILVIAFLVYFTFFSGKQSSISKKISDQHQREGIYVMKEQELYICRDSAKIRSLPQKNAKILRSINKGEKISVIAQKDEWFQLKSTEKSQKEEWIEKRFVCIKPPQENEKEKSKQEDESSSPDKGSTLKKEKKEDHSTGETKTSPSPITSPNNPPSPGVYPNLPPNFPPPNFPPQGYSEMGSGDKMETLVNGLFNIINSRAQGQYGQVLFNDFNVLDGGMRLEAKATSVWNQLLQPYKNQVLQTLTNQYTLIACNETKIVNCTPDNTPSISIVDSSGREVAYQNSHGSQVLE